MHEPPDYDCPFCKIVSDAFDDVETERADIVLRNDSITAFVASHHWGRNTGNVLIITNAHYQDLYSLPSSVAVPLQEATKQIALAFKSAFGCTGTSTRKHNKPEGASTCGIITCMYSPGMKAITCIASISKSPIPPSVASTRPKFGRL